MSRNQRILAIIAAILIIGGAGYWFKSGLEKSDEIKIGSVLLLSGDNALWGENARKAIDMIAHEINGAGGIDGKKLSVVYEDSKGDPKTAVSAFRKLVDIDHVPAILGDMISSTVLAMAPLADQYGVILMGISSSAPAVSNAGSFVYRVWPSDLYEGKVFAEWVHEKGYQNVGILHLNNEYGNGLKDAFKIRFIGLGGAVTIEEAYNSGDIDLRAITTKAKQANPQAVYVVGYYEDTARMVKQLRQSGYQGKILGTSSSIHVKLFEIAGDAADGFAAALVNDFDVEALTPSQKAFVDKFRARYSVDPDWAATHAADAIKVFVSCFEKGSRNGKELKECIDSVRSFEGVNKSVSFDENGDVINKPLAVQEAHKGKFVTIWRQ